MIRVSGSIIGCMLSLSLPAQGQGTAADPYVLNPSASTVVWGYYWSEAKPVLHVRSGDYVRVRTVLTSNPERLEGAGVPPAEVEQELRDVQAVKDRGPGGHVLTGPIYVDGADSGDVLEVRFDSINLAIPYGYNGIGQAGFLSDEIFSRKMRIIRLDREKMIGHFADRDRHSVAPLLWECGGGRRRRRRADGTAHRRGYMGEIWIIRSLVAGTTLYLPVWVKGALARDRRWSCGAGKWRGGHHGYRDFTDRKIASCCS